MKKGYKLILLKDKLELVEIIGIAKGVRSPFPHYHVMHINNKTESDSIAESLVDERKLFDLPDCVTTRFTWARK